MRSVSWGARRGAPWGGAPAEGPRGGALPPRGPVGGGAPAEGPGGGSPKRLHKAPTDFTKPQQTIESPDRLYKDIARLYKHIIIRQNLKILDMNLN